MTQLGNASFIQTNNASNWNPATDGQSWSVQSGAATLSISSNEGLATGVTALTYIQLGSTTSADAEAVVRTSVSSTNYTASGIVLRATGTTTFYRARINSNSSSIGIGIVKTVAGTSTNLFTASFTASTNTFYWLRFRIVGTALMAKVWASGSAEPDSWTVSGTDSSITGAGGFGINVNTTTSGDTAKYDSFYAVDYIWADSVPAADSALFGRAGLFTDALTADDTIPVSNPMSSTDSLSISDIGGLQRWSIDALSVSDRFAGGIDTTPAFVESLSITESIFAYAYRSDPTRSLLDIDVVGNGFIPGLPGIYGNVFLQILPGLPGNTYVSVYSPDGHVLLGYLTFADFYFLLLTPQGVLWLADQAVNIDQVGGVAVTAVPVTLLIGGVSATNANPLPIQDIEQAGYISATSPPSNTNSGSDTTYTFSSQVNRVILENHTASNVYYAFDQAASQGALLLAPGATLVYPKKVTVVHLWTAASQAINGSSAGNIVVLGAL